MKSENKDLEYGPGAWGPCSPANKMPIPAPPSPTTTTMSHYQVPDWEGTKSFEIPFVRCKKAMQFLGNIAIWMEKSLASSGSGAVSMLRKFKSFSTFSHKDDTDKTRKMCEVEWNSTSHVSTQKDAPSKGEKTDRQEPPCSTSNSISTSNSSGRRKFKYISFLGKENCYCGLRRRKFILLIFLPLIILFFIVLPLSIGLGIGLRSRTRKEASLPLPSNKGVFTGDITYYYPGLGACGWNSNESDGVVAVSRLVWDAVQVGTNPNTNSLCGRRIRVRREFDGSARSVDVRVVDRCVGCKAYDLDLTPEVFTRLANHEDGRVKASWAWLNEDDNEMG